MEKSNLLFPSHLCCKFTHTRFNKSIFISHYLKNKFKQVEKKINFGSKYDDSANVKGEVNG